jgi:hypothetical protein
MRQAMEVEVGDLSGQMCVVMGRRVQLALEVPTYISIPVCSSSAIIRLNNIRP